VDDYGVICFVGAIWENHDLENRKDIFQGFNPNLVSVRVLCKIVEEVRALFLNYNLPSEND